MKNENTGCLEYVELDLKENVAVATLKNTNAESENISRSSNSSSSTANQNTITSTTTTTTKATTGIQLSAVDDRLRIASKDIRNSGMLNADDDEEEEEDEEVG